MDASELQAVELRVVDEALVAATGRAAARAQSLLDDAGVLADVRAMGSSAHAGSVSKGDIDLLVTTSLRHFGALTTALTEWFTPAQTGNWTEEFASFTDPEGVGWQAMVQGSTAELQMQRQSQALDVPDLRARYDIAKRHGAMLGPAGYWEVKNAFWGCLDKTGPAWVQPSSPVSKILRGNEWLTLLRDGSFAGSMDDRRDGFIHLSAPDQVAGTIARHFPDDDGLWVVTMDADLLGGALRWEESRGGEKFPHLYGTMVLGDVALARPWRPGPLP